MTDNQPTAADAVAAVRQYCSRARETFRGMHAHLTACRQAVLAAQKAEELAYPMAVNTVLRADHAARASLLHRVWSALERAQLELHISEDAIESVDHRVSCVLALDLLDTLPWEAPNAQQ